MSAYEEYSDAQARADDGLPAKPGDAEIIAAGDERLGWTQARYTARRHDEAIEETTAAEQPTPDIAVTRRMAYALATAHGRTYAPVEAWNARAGQDGTEALVDLGLLRRGLAERGEWTGCLYVTDAGRRGVRVAVDRADNSLYVCRPRGDWPPGEGISDEDFAEIAELILAAAEPPRPPGRPPVGRPINTRLSDEQLAKVEARAQAAAITRAEMIRRLVEVGLEVEVVAEIDGLRDGETLVVERTVEL